MQRLHLSAISDYDFSGSGSQDPDQTLVPTISTTPAAQPSSPSLPSTLPLSEPVEGQTAAPQPRQAAVPSPKHLPIKEREEVKVQDTKCPGELKNISPA